MSRFALPALVLITCEARRGEWVSLHTLIARLETAGHHIERAAAQLVAENKLAHATHASHPYWGVGVEGHLPTAGTPTKPPPTNARPQPCNTGCDHPCIHLDESQ